MGKVSMAALILCVSLVALSTAVSVGEAAVVEHTFVVSKYTSLSIRLSFSDV
jgi:laccase